MLAAIMHVETLVVGEFAVNCYVVHGTDGRACVVDPGEDAQTVLSHVQINGLTVAAYLLTHGHMDHISGLAEMCEAAPAPVYVHAEDLEWAYAPANQMPPYYDVPRRPNVEHRPFTGGETFTAAGIRFQVIRTPGHTSGSSCFLLPDQDALFTGDTLFAGSIGRTDLPTASPEAMQQSLTELASLPDRLTVYPGHGPVTTIGTERTINPFLTGKARPKA